MSWSVHLVETLTGIVGARLPAAATGTWSDKINGAQELKVKVPTPWVLAQGERATPWRASLLLCWNDEPVVLAVIQDGVGDDEFWEYSCAGLWALLQDRVVTDRDYDDAGLTRAEMLSMALRVLKGWASDDKIAAAAADALDTGVYHKHLWTDGWTNPASDAGGVVVQLLGWHRELRGTSLAESVVTLRNLSEGSIARRLVELAQQRPNGWFPIAYGSPLEATGHQRTLKGFNLGNNSVAHELELIAGGGGPDIAFRPRWKERGSKVEWLMVHGTEGMAEIAQDRQWAIDLTAKKSPASTRKVTRKESPWMRAYVTGAGQDEGLLIRVVSNPSPPQGMPWRETVIANSQEEDGGLLADRGRAALRERPVVQAQVQVSAHDYQPGLLWAGDAVDVWWPSGWVQLPGGRYVMRPLEMSGSLDSEMVTLEMQPQEL